MVRPLAGRNGGHAHPAGGLAGPGVADEDLAGVEARLVAKGFHQQPGIDYDETYNPVIKPTTVRTILSIAIFASQSIHQIDIQNAFLHGTLSEVVFMTQPPSYQHPQYPHHVCKL